jgi:hypothetical protein
MPICHFCRKPIASPIGPDRDEQGRVAHWQCSTGPAYRGEWSSIPFDLGPETAGDGSPDRITGQLHSGRI